VLWQAAQLSLISAALDAARGGQPTVLGVLGEPGMGKTSLLREIAARSSPRLRGRASGASIPPRLRGQRRRAWTDPARTSSACAVISMSMHASVTDWP
jgi:GTPase SAR1 family protein